MRFEIDGAPVFAYTGSRALTGEQPCMVFVHGAGLDHSVWTLHARYFAHHGYDVVVPDLPGHGRSGGEPLPSIGAMGDWVLRVPGALGHEGFAVLGHSMGSLVALETAARGGDRLWHAALLGTSVPMAVTDQLLSAAEGNRHAAYDMINIWGHAMGSQIGGNRSPGMWMTGGAVRLLERSGPGVLHSDLRACGAYGEGLESAARVRCPVHLIVGQRDLMTPARGARALADALPDATVTQLAGSGHMLMSERPNETLDALIASVGAARPEIP